MERHSTFDGPSSVFRPVITDAGGIAELKAASRREANRASAAQSRERNKQYIKMLEDNAQKYAALSLELTRLKESLWAAHAQETDRLNARIQILEQATARDLSVLESALRQGLDGLRGVVCAQSRDIEDLRTSASAAPAASAPAPVDASQPTPEYPAEELQDSIHVSDDHGVTDDDGVEIDRTKQVCKKKSCSSFPKHTLARHSSLFNKYLGYRRNKKRARAAKSK